MNLSPLEHPRPIPVKPHTRSRPYVQAYNTTTRRLIREVEEMRFWRQWREFFIAAVMEESRRG